MARLTRVYQNIFGSSAGAGEIGKFGSLAAGSPITTTDPAVIQALSQFLEGWASAIVGSNSPAIEDMNALFFLLYRQLAYIFEEGVPEWDATTTYYTGSLVTNGGGSIYRSLANANVNNAVTDTTKWAMLGGGLTSVSTTYSALITDDVIRANPTSGGFTITLPTVASAVGKRITVKDIGTNSNIVTVKGNGSELIDGANTYVQLYTQYDSATFYCNGTTWDVI